VRDALTELGARDVAVIGISPDTPLAQKKFDDKYALGFPLLSDPDHKIAEAFGVWGEKKMYGKSFMGILRSSFLIDESGRIENVWYKISPKNTVSELMKVLG
jgi:thioredoxin-dependent peroxiredoxin